jgi:hypothetical protein
VQRNQHPFNGLEQGPDFDRARSMISTPFQYVDIALDVASSDQIFNVSGDFLYCDAATTGVAELELNNQYNDSAAPFTLQQGFALECLFKQIKLSWTAQPGKKIRLLYSTGARIVPTNIGAIVGTVSVVNGALQRTLDNQAFMCYIQAPAAAAQYPECQLWNPAGSGKKVYVESMTISTPTAQAVQIGYYNAQLAVAGPGVLNKSLGGGVGGALARYTTDAAVLLTAGGPVFNLAANAVQVINFTEPVYIPPGRGFNVSGLTVLTVLNCNFEWFEQ